jgi:orotidine-5'-phosphate decarboxylase
MDFSERLATTQKTANSLLCVGLDTDPAKLPGAIRGSDDAVIEFNRRIIEATSDLVCAYKLNLAFYEAIGEWGWSILRRTLSHVPEGVLTIGDAKRGDIGNTAALYAQALFKTLGVQAATVNPYLGFDSVEPFLSDPERGAFILAGTSNPGARDFQYLKVGTRPLYERVIRKVKSWNMKGNCGVVVGATRPAELRRIRALVPDMPILIPGIGAQGGNLKSAVRYGCSRNGLLALINASRSVLYASGGEDFAEAARREATRLRDEINRYRAAFFPRSDH